MRSSNLDENYLTAALFVIIFFIVAKFAMFISCNLCYVNYNLSTIISLCYLIAESLTYKI